MIISKAKGTTKNTKNTKNKTKQKIHEPLTTTANIGSRWQLFLRAESDILRTRCTNLQFLTNAIIIKTKVLLPQE